MVLCYKFLKLLFFSQLCAHNHSLFPKTLTLNYLESHHHDRKQQKFKIQTNQVPWSVPILIALFIQNHVFILPP